MICKTSLIFCTFYERSTGGTIIFWDFLDGNNTSVIIWFVRLIIFKFCPWFSLFFGLGGEEGGERYRSTVLFIPQRTGSPTVTIVPFPVPRLTAHIAYRTGHVFAMALSLLGLQHGERLPDIPECVSAQIDRKWSWALPTAWYSSFT